MAHVAALVNLHYCHCVGLGRSPLVSGWSTLLAQMSFGLCASLLLFLARSTSLVFTPGLVGTSFLFTVATWVVTFFRFKLVLGPQSQHSKNTDFRQPENTTNNESMPPVLVSERVQFVGRFRVPFRESQSAFKVGPRNINHEGGAISGARCWFQFWPHKTAPQNAKKIEPKLAQLSKAQSVYCLWLAEKACFLVPMSRT